MSVLTCFFNREAAHSSPVVPDFNRVVKYDDSGAEVVLYEKVDNSKIQMSNGISDDWSLSNLLKAGIDPVFNIHTGNNTRLDGLSQLNDAIAFGNELLDKIDENSKSE